MRYLIGSVILGLLIAALLSLVRRTEPRERG